MTSEISKSIHLGPLDAAIVLRLDGTMEAAMPELDLHELPDNILTGAAVMMALQNERISDLIYDNFMTECALESVVPINDL